MINSYKVLCSSVVQYCRQSATKSRECSMTIRGIAGFGVVHSSIRHFANFLRRQPSILHLLQSHSIRNSLLCLLISMYDVVNAKWLYVVGVHLRGMHKCSALSLLPSFSNTIPQQFLTVIFRAQAKEKARSTTG